MFKRILSALFIGLILTMTLTTYSSARQAQQVREDVLRLHVLANSDSEADQALKLKVRDGVLDKARALFSEAGDRDAAYAIAARNTAALQQAALQIIAEEGYDYPVVVTVGEQFFPTKAYEGGIRLPPGITTRSASKSARQREKTGGACSIRPCVSPARSPATTRSWRTCSTPMKWNSSVRTRARRSRSSSSWPSGGGC